MSSVGEPNQPGSSPPPWLICHARRTMFSSSGSRSGKGRPYRTPSSRNAAAPGSSAARASQGPPQRVSFSGASDLRGRRADEVGDVAGRNDHAVHTRTLELLDLVAGPRADVG